MPLACAAGIGSMLGSGIIVGLSANIAIWQTGIGLTDGQVGVLSGALTFAIAAGSLLAGNITKGLGLVRTFNIVNVLYLIGAITCALSQNYGMLLTGLILAGLASGIDLPVSLSIISHDVPDDATSARLIATTQVFWQGGVLGSYALSFIVSHARGTIGARIVFGLLAGFAALAAVWRTLSPQFREFHRAGNQHYAAMDKQENTTITLATLFSGNDGRRFRQYFACILLFYVCCSLLMNTFGQFQTYMLVKANASQDLATGCGIVLNILGVVCGILFASAAGSRHRNLYFYIGIVIQAAAMFGIACGGSTILMIVAMIACYTIGNQFAGESISKVWTQESFPASARTSVQGFINGFSRFCCGLFALITPYLVDGRRIRFTMYGFAGIVLISAAAGIRMITLQHRQESCTS